MIEFSANMGIRSSLVLIRPRPWAARPVETKSLQCRSRTCPRPNGTGQGVLGSGWLVLDGH